MHFVQPPYYLSHAVGDPQLGIVFFALHIFSTNSTSYLWINASSRFREVALKTSQPPNPVPWCTSRTPKVNFGEQGDHPAGPLQKWGLAFQCPPIETQTVHLNWLLDMTRTGLPLKLGQNALIRVKTVERIVDRERGLVERNRAMLERCTIWSSDRGIGECLYKLGCFLLFVNRRPIRQTSVLIVDPPGAWGSMQAEASVLFTNCDGAKCWGN